MGLKERIEKLEYKLNPPEKISNRTEDHLTLNSLIKIITSEEFKAGDKPKTIELINSCSDILEYVSYEEIINILENVKSIRPIK